MDFKKKMQEFKRGEDLYRMPDIKIRFDMETKELEAFICEFKPLGNARVFGKEQSLTHDEIVLRWEGMAKPGGRGLVRNYLNQELGHRYGIIYQRADVFAKYLQGEEYDENRLYSKEELIELMQTANENFKEKSKNQGREEI